MKPTITVHSDPTIYADGPFTASVDLSGYEIVRLPFWTPAERAGLKAMGRVSLSCIDGSFTHREPMQYAIRAYVKAARTVKESLGS